MLKSWVAAMNKTDIPEQLGGMTGKYLFGSSGEYFGRVLGKSGKLILNDLVRGSGDYTIKSNSITGVDTVPMFGGNATRVKNKEFVKDISSSANAGAFKLETFRINPANTTLFPWLSEIAEQFSEYRFHGLLFEYKTTSVDALNSTNTALGTVIMATQYNAYEDNFTTKQFMENSTYACSTKPSCNLIHGIECAKFENPVSILYTAAGVPDEGDLRLYDMGKFSIASQGMQAASVTIGELWVTYDVELIKPREISSPDLVSHFILDAATTTGANPLGTTGPTGSVNNDLGVVVNTTNRTISINNFTGKMMVSYQLRGLTPANVVAPVFTPSGGATALNVVGDNGIGLNGLELPASTAITDCTVTKYFNINLSGVVTLGNAGTLPGNLVVADLIVATIPSNLDVIDA